MIKSQLKPAWVFVSLATLVVMPVFYVYSADPPQKSLDEQIKEKSEEVKKLEEEAKKYRDTLEGIGRQADSLESQIKSLDQNVNRLNANIRVTKAKINLVTLEIKELEEGIQEKETEVGKNRTRLGDLINSLSRGDRESPLEIMMKNDSISSFFSSLEGIVTIQRGIQGLLGDLRTAKEELKNQKGKDEKKKKELTSLVNKLADQKSLQEYERKERANLLNETKNQERRYRELLADVERRRDSLQTEINALESDLKTTFDRSLLPKAGSGILGWPLPDPVFITQYFGNTSFARAGGYNGKGHNGIDFRAGVGTPVFASESGIVRASGDTDASCRRASYGRWILIDHLNNLATLVAHLSLTKVRPGDIVSRGELIGYSGRTGYATGPHLHLTVFAKQAVEIGQLRSRVCGRIMTLPLSPFGGYLNPLDYL